MPTARLRNDLPVARIRSDLPTGRTAFGAILTAGTDTLVTPGTPIGLLLVLTYTNAFTASSGATFKGIAPLGRIRATD